METAVTANQGKDTEGSREVSNKANLANLSPEASHIQYKAFGELLRMAILYSRAACFSPKGHMQVRASCTDYHIIHHVSAFF